MLTAKEDQEGHFAMLPPDLGNPLGKPPPRPREASAEDDAAARESALTAKEAALVVKEEAYAAREAARSRAVAVAVGETVILLHPPLHLVGVSV